MTPGKAYLTSEEIRPLAERSDVMLADGNGFFTKSIGMDMNTSDFGGTRSVRYSMLVEDGEVVKIFVEDPGRFEVSDAETMLKNL